MFTKPECKICSEENFFDAELAKKLLYSIFNPYYREEGKFDVGEFIRSKIKDRELYEYFENYSMIFNDMLKGLGYSESLWMDKFEEYVNAKKEAWEELKSLIARGEIDKGDISASDLLDFFYEEIIEDMIDLDLIKGISRRVFEKKVIFSEAAEKLVADKIMEEAMKGAKDYDYESEGETISPFPSYEFVEFDEFFHHFDLIDIPETMVRAAMRGFEIKEIVARAPKKVGKRSYVMLIDVSDSMRGKKIIGAIEAAITLKNSIKASGDDCDVLAFNHETFRIREGDILNLQVRGMTDIGLSLKKATEILKNKEGKRVIFLITDGMPTTSYNPYYTPWKTSIIEARKLRNYDIHLYILMLNDDPRFYEFCLRMVKESGKGQAYYFPNPLNLKNYICRRVSK